MKEHQLALSPEQARRRRIFRHPAGHFEASRVTLQQLITEAYGVRAYEIVDAPEWVSRDHFDVEARAPLGAVPDDTDTMLRWLLEDRFDLEVRYERRRMPVFVLETADSRRRLGPGIRRPPGHCVDAPSVFTAVREQLGLTLEPRQDDMPVLVVARVQRPSPN